MTLVSGLNSAPNSWPMGKKGHLIGFQISVIQTSNPNPSVILVHFNENGVLWDKNIEDYEKVGDSVNQA